MSNKESGMVCQKKMFKVRPVTKSYKDKNWGKANKSDSQTYIEKDVYTCDMKGPTFMILTSHGSSDLGSKSPEYAGLFPLYFIAAF